MIFNAAHTPAIQEQLSRDYSFSVRGDLFAATHKVQDGRLRILADRDAKRDAELFETYGDNPNAIYMQYHGFVPDVNPSACVPFSLSELARDILGSAHRKQMAIELRLTRRASYCVPAPAYVPRDDTDTFPKFPQFVIDHVQLARMPATQKRALWRSPTLDEANAKTVMVALHRWAKKLLANDYNSADESAVARDRTGVATLVHAYVQQQRAILEQWLMPEPAAATAWRQRQAQKTLEKSEL